MTKKDLDILEDDDGADDGSPETYNDVDPDVLEDGGDMDLIVRQDEQGLESISMINNESQDADEDEGDKG